MEKKKKPTLIAAHKKSGGNGIGEDEKKPSCLGERILFVWSELLGLLEEGRGQEKNL